MIKLILLFTFITTLLFSKSTESCYTVQLVSKYNSQKNLDFLNSKTYPPECKLMEIGKSLTVRCSCFEKYSDADKSLHMYQENYKIAVIATTYKYRFDDSLLEKSILSKISQKNIKTTNISSSKKYKKQKNVLELKPRSKKDEELRLILQVFLYKGDIQSAYKVASLGYDRYPKSYYWNQKMAMISKWTNRSADAMKHMRIMYDIQPNPKIEEELIKYGVSAYQYEDIEPLVINRAHKNPTEENIDLLILVFRKIGSPEKVVAVLEDEYKKDNNRMLLSKALEISLEMGDLELAYKYVSILEKEKPYSKKEAVLISKYYYVTRDMEKAYSSLSYVNARDINNTTIVIANKNNHGDVIKTDTITYYELKSDLGWYFQDNTKAAEASNDLINMQAGRLVDYERVTFVYQKTDPKLAAFVTKVAYKKYKLNYLFYSYANGAINSKNFNALDDFLQEIDENRTSLTKESLYWLVKAKVYGYFHKDVLAKEALDNAYMLEPNNFQIKQELLFFYMDKHDGNNAKMILLDMAENENLLPNMYLTLASAYYELNDINRASYYTQLLLSIDHPSTRSLNFKFLQAYIYQVQNNDEAFKNLMIEILSMLKENAKSNPKLKKKNIYLSNYLRSAMYLLNPNKFEKKLQKAKRYLSKKNYNEIAYSWAIHNKAYEKSLKIYNRMHIKELWMRFSNAITFQNHTEIENILDLYIKSISVGDAVQELHKDGQVALAQSQLFEGMLHNQRNQNAYVQYLSLSRERSDELDIKTSYYNRDPLLQKYVSVDNKTYLQDGYYLLSKLFYSKNSSLDETILSNVPSNNIMASLSLKRLYTRGYIMASFTYNSVMKDYYEFSINGNYRLSTDLIIDATVGKNMKALESTQLLLGGKKDMITCALTWKILNSTNIDFMYEYNRYNSQDRVYLGDGQYSRITISQQIRNGYPDLKISGFYDRGVYEETTGTRGVIDLLQIGEQNALPLDFYNIGMALSYGMANSNLYTRVWRPYIEVSPYYNSEIKNYTYGVNAGYGGKIFHQDHVSLGVSYTDSVNGVGGSILELYLKYQFMYYHP